MTVFGVRVFLFSVLPLLLAPASCSLTAQHLLANAVSKSRSFNCSVLGSRPAELRSFFGHLFFSDVVADSVGWPRGSPFQHEMAFANLAVGILGIGPPAAATASERPPSSR